MKKSCLFLAAAILSVAMAGCAPAGSQTAADQTSRIGMNEYGTYLIDGAGTLWVWGRNTSGELGLGTEVPQVNEPVKLMEKVKKISTGVSTNALALKEDGSVWQWGNRNGGVQSTPVQVLEGAVDIAAANDGGLAVLEGGEVWAWGEGIYGIERSDEEGGYKEPYQVMYNGSSVYAGDGFAVLTTDGELFIWGYMCGDFLKTPQKAADHVRRVHYGGTTYFQKDDGSLWGFGNNYYGQLGNGKSFKDVEGLNYFISDPIKIAGSVTDFVSDGMTLYYISKGKLWGCGNNDYGQLGTGEASPLSTRVVKEPVLVDEGVSAVWAARFQAVYYQKEDGLWACGSNFLGQLGNGADYTRTCSGSPMISTPYRVMEGNVVELLSRDSSVVCLTGEGGVKVWGKDPLHYFEELAWETPPTLPELTGKAAELINTYQYVNKPTDLPMPEGFVIIISDN